MTNWLTFWHSFQLCLSSYTEDADLVSQTQGFHSPFTKSFNLPFSVICCLTQVSHRHWGKWQWCKSCLPSLKRYSVHLAVRGPHWAACYIRSSAGIMHLGGCQPAWQDWECLTAAQWLYETYRMCSSKYCKKQAVCWIFLKIILLCLICKLFTCRQIRCASLAKGFYETLLPCPHCKQRGLQKEVGMGHFWQLDQRFACGIFYHRLGSTTCWYLTVSIFIYLGTADG